MKLFNAIVAAAVIGTSVIAVAPEAKADFWLDYAFQINNEIMNDLDRLDRDLERLTPRGTNCTVINTYGYNYSVDCW
tara:strand:+ start:550 stop:780 length:231 start_codon:yes stop_codon:yes gene_type:complete